MGPFPWLDAAIIVGLILLNGFFAMSELAIVSARRPRLRAMQTQGVRGAGTALALAEDSGRFLSGVQIGITLVGIINGAYSGATLAGPVGERLTYWFGLPPTLAEEVGFGVVIAIATYLSLIVGELVPKQFALRSPETIAAMVAPFMRQFARLTTPFVWVLDQSSQLVFRLLRQNRDNTQTVTEEELRSVVADAASAGVIEAEESQLIAGIMRLADRRVRGVMTPRGEIDWIDADADEAAVRAQLATTPHSRLLVALRDADIPMALVHDEYGHFEGIVTPSDLLAAIAGAFRSDIDDFNDPPAVERDDGSWLISGALPADELAETLGLTLPDERDYETAAGLALEQLRHLPETGEKFRISGWQFEIIDMDGRKIDKLLASRVTPTIESMG